MSSPLAERLVNAAIAAVFLTGAAAAKIYKVDGLYELCLIASGVSGGGKVSVAALFSKRPPQE